MKILKLLYKINSTLINLGKEEGLNFGFEISVCERTNNIFLINDHLVWESGNLRDKSSLRNLVRFVIQDLREAREEE